MAFLVLDLSNLFITLNATGYPVALVASLTNSSQGGDFNSRQVLETTLDLHRKMSCLGKT